MKVLLNVSRDFQHDEWIECEGIKLVEASDGSLDLIVTTDLARMREADKRVEDLLGRIQSSKPSSNDAPTPGVSTPSEQEERRG